MWFLKKFLMTPAVWLGSGVGLFTGMAFANNGPTSGAVGFGTSMGIGAIIIIFAFMKVVQMAYQNAQKSRQERRIARKFDCHGAPRFGSGRRSCFARENDGRSRCDF